MDSNKQKRVQHYQERDDFKQDWNDFQSERLQKNGTLDLASEHGYESIVKFMLENASSFKIDI